MVIAVADPPSPVHVTEQEVVRVGETTAEPDVPFMVKPPPVQDEAFVELHDPLRTVPRLTTSGWLKAKRQARPAA